MGRGWGRWEVDQILKYDPAAVLAEEVSLILQSVVGSDFEVSGGRL